MDAAAKQQIVERVKQATNVLVTVSSNPTVDQLAACIGLTLMLNKMEKHGTAVFSGQVPSTLEFLQPEKTIEANTDSLRDFIISLDKNKADKLRYKVEDQVVRIFITPYRTSLTEKDMVFSQGDINVEVVIALGVQDRRQIDAAITAHGRILHDATVISVNNGPGAAPQLGQINWQDPTASSLSEMLASISEAFGSGLIDNQIATALLTGIVAETKRFSNAKTSPKVMTIAAQLMAAGANQQLIASKLDQPPVPPKPTFTPLALQPVPAAKPKPAQKPKDRGELDVSHDKAKPDSPEVEIAPGEIHIDEKGNLKTTDDLKAEIEQLKKMRDKAAPPPERPMPPPPIIPPAPPTPPPPAEPEPPMPPPPAPIAPAPVMPPASLPQLDGGMTQPIIVSPSAPAPKPHELLDPSNHQPSFNSPFSADTQAGWVDPYDSVSLDPLGGNNPMLSQSQNGGMTAGHDRTVQPPVEPAMPPLTLTPEAPLPGVAAQAAPPVAPIAAPAAPAVTPAVPALDNARSAVESAIASAPFDAAFEPASPINPASVAPPAPPGPLVNNSVPTPSFQLPASEATANASPAVSDMAPAAPPAVPPPLMPAPGIVIPNGAPAQPLF